MKVYSHPMTKKISSVIPVLVAILFLGVLHFSNLSTILELKSLDFFRTPHKPHPDIVILAIDNKSLEEIGRWPWNRSIHAELLTSLASYEPELVAYDVTFSDVSEPQADEALVKSLTEVPYPVVLTSQALYRKNEQAPFSVLSPLRQFTTSPNITVGSANIFLSEDGLARIFPKPIIFENKEHLPFSFTISKLLNAPRPPDNAQINFAGPSRTFKTISVVDVLNKRIDKEILQGKIILIGATASDLQDILLVPGFRQILPGIEYHANIVDNMLLQRYIKAAQPRLPLMIGSVILMLFIFLSYKKSGRLILIFLTAALVTVPLVSFVAWQQGVALPYAANTIFVALLLGANALYRWYTTAKEKRKIKANFQNYFSPQVLQYILSHPDQLSLSGKKADVTIFFSDIRNFTTISEALPPEKLTHLLNEYFNEMTEEVLKTDGVVDKFIGDAIMAFWGAPIPQKDSADRAVEAALGMIKRLKKLQEKWAKENLPLVNIGVGINTGEVIIGNMGSSKRFDYTVIGDNVNLASRLEGLNKEYNTNIILSEATKNRLTIPCEIKA